MQIKFTKMSNNKLSKQINKNSFKIKINAWFKNVATKIT